MSFQKKKGPETYSPEAALKILEPFLQLPENRECIDCGAKAPRWASVNLGILMCTRCSGIHRSLGTHISRVRSVSLDKWTSEQIEALTSVGNGKAKRYFEATVPSNYHRPKEADSTQVLEAWMRAKYERREFVAKNTSNFNEQEVINSSKNQQQSSHIRKPSYDSQKQQNRQNSNTRTNLTVQITTPTTSLSAPSTLSSTSSSSSPSSSALSSPSLNQNRNFSQNADAFFSNNSQQFFSFDEPKTKESIQKPNIQSNVTSSSNHSTFSFFDDFNNNNNNNLKNLNQPKQQQQQQQQSTPVISTPSTTAQSQSTSSFFTGDAFYSTNSTLIEPEKPKYSKDSIMALYGPSIPQMTGGIKQNVMMNTMLPNPNTMSPIFMMQQHQQQQQMYFNVLPNSFYTLPTQTTVATNFINPLQNNQYLNMTTPTTMQVPISTSTNTTLSTNSQFSTLFK
eukprot:TRINITY_DN506_c0_g1_i2.p1 TRINITY_DN506_c0_g1~~TRINITY_DN506_c0_g1_i2.p1  ORF type:complete len:451 (+),score=264.27 TRINITY_DN506_c0_g1_i2:68-1420(+)